MLNVTPDARERLTLKLARKKAGEHEAMRFTSRPGGWKLSVDCARPADTAVIHKGRMVLLLDKAASRAMRKATLDVHDTGEGPRLKLT
jgi:hypothetical protein